MIDKLKDMIRRFEGLRLNPYQCPAGVWTVGFGHTRGVKPGVKITHRLAEAMLAEDAFDAAIAAGKASPVLWGDDARHAAIADFIFNLGATRYKASTLKKRVDAEDWDAAAAEIRRWVFGGGKRLPGLVKRREAEARLLTSQ